MFLAFLRLCVFSAILLAAVLAAQEAPPTADFQPITYFQKNCARCHGPGGAYYDLKHLALLDDEKLRQVISDMAEGSGQAPLSAQQTAIETALHRSFLDGKPFIFANAPKADGATHLLSGEVSPESKVEIIVGKTSVFATVTDSAWQAILPAKSDLSNAIMRAANGQTITELRLADGYSHK